MLLSKLSETENRLPLVSMQQSRLYAPAVDERSCYCADCLCSSVGYLTLSSATAFADLLQHGATPFEPF